jgi:hypothetical protein
MTSDINRDTIVVMGNTNWSGHIRWILNMKNRLPKQPTDAIVPKKT